MDPTAKVKAGYDALDEKTAMAMIPIYLEVVGGIKQLGPKNTLYTGAMASTDKIPPIPYTEFERYVYSEAVLDREIDAPVENAGFVVEFATNMIRVGDGQPSMVSSKYYGFQPMPTEESVLEFVVTEDDEPTLTNDEFALDFFFNIINHLELVTEAQIMTFLATPLPPGAKGYLLSDEQVATLMTDGVHMKLDDVASGDQLLGKIHADVVALNTALGKIVGDDDDEEATQ